MCNPALGSAALTYYSGLIAGMAEFCSGFSKVEPTVEADEGLYRRQRHRRHRDAGRRDHRHQARRSAPATSSTCCRCRPPRRRPSRCSTTCPTARTTAPISSPAALYAERLHARQRDCSSTRNPAWKAESDPLRKAYVDEIEITFGLQVDAIMQQLQSGDGDMTYDVTIPPAILQTLTAAGDEKLMTVVVGQYQFHLHQHGVGQQQRRAQGPRGPPGAAVRRRQGGRRAAAGRADGRPAGERHLRPRRARLPRVQPLPVHRRQGRSGKGQGAARRGRLPRWHHLEDAVPQQGHGTRGRPDHPGVHGARRNHARADARWRRRTTIRSS